MIPNAEFFALDPQSQGPFARISLVVPRIDELADLRQTQPACGAKTRRPPPARQCCCPRVWRNARGAGGGVDGVGVSNRVWVYPLLMPTYFEETQICFCSPRR